MSLPTDPLFQMFIRPALADEMRKAFERMENTLSEVRKAHAEKTDQLERVAAMAGAWSAAMRKTAPDTVAEYIASLQELIFRMERIMTENEIPIPILTPDGSENTPTSTCDFCGVDHATPEMPEGMDMHTMFRRFFQQN
jgi:hypothetical protein